MKARNLHQKKSGTPTMGGIMILLSIIVATLIMVNQYAELTYKTFLLLFVQSDLVY